MNSIVLIGMAVLMTLAVLPLFRSREKKKITDEVRRRASGEFVHLSKGFTHYEAVGPEDGPVIVLVHGFSVPYYVWDMTIGALTAAGFKVIRYELYGRGLSDRPDVCYDRRLFVDQLAELIDALGIQGAVLLAGYSMGGAVVAAFAATFPQKVAKVLLIDPLCERQDIGVLHIPLLGEYLAYGFQVPAMPVKQEEDFCFPEKFPEWDERFREQMRYKGFRRAILSTQRHFMSHDPSPDYETLGKQGKPVFLVWGAEDRTLGTNGVSKLRSLLYPDFLWVEQAGHLPHYEYPDIVNPRMVSFLKS